MKTKNLLGAFAIVAALPAAHYGVNYVTSEGRFNDMRARLDSFEGMELDQPHIMACTVSADNISMPNRISVISGGVFTEHSMDGIGCDAGTFIRFGELVETGLFDVSLTRLYEDADASVETPKVCVSNITETVVFGIPVSSNSAYECVTLDQ